MAQTHRSNIHSVFFFLIISLLSSGYHNALLAQEKYSNEFLQIGVGARSLGMANSVIASTHDVHAGYWNPANLTRIENIFQVGFMHASYFANIANYDYGAVAVPTDNGVIGVSVIRFGIDDIQNTINLIDQNGNFNYANITLFSTVDYGFLVSYARKIGPEGLSVGGNAKIIYRQLGDFARAYGFGLDAAISYEKKYWKFAGVIRDVTTTVNAWSYTLDDNTKEVFVQTGNEIPTNTTELTLPTAVVGTARDIPIKDLFVVTPEVNFEMTFGGMRPTLISSEGINIDPRLGLEVSYNNFIFLRGGVGQVQREPKPFEDGHNYLVQSNFGLGIMLTNLFGLGNVAIDYALTNIGETDGQLYSNIFSVRMDFNGNKL